MALKISKQTRQNIMQNMCTQYFTLVKTTGN